jgi:hypothetical protein
MGSKHTHGCAQIAENGFGFDFFLEPHYKDGDEFLNHIVTLVSFMKVETKKQ